MRNALEIHLVWELALALVLAHLKAARVVALTAEVVRFLLPRADASQVVLGNMEINIHNNMDYFLSVHGDIVIML